SSPPTSEPPPQAVEPQFHELSGIVFGGGLPLEGVLVEASSEEGSVGQLSYFQGFQLQLEDGSYDLRITPPEGSGFAEQVVEGVVLVGADRRHDVVLVAAPVAVRGSIFGYARAPVVGAAVHLLEQSSGTSVAAGTTDASGHYELPCSPGTYVLSALPPALSPAGTPNEAWSFQSPELRVAATTELDVALAVAKLTGRVTEESGGAAVGATVQASTERVLPDNAFSLSQSSTRTNAEGAYELLVFDGDGTLTLRATSGSGASSRLAVVGDQQRDFVLPPGVPIAGRVLDGAGVGVPGLRVTAYDATSGLSRSTTTSDAAGHYELSGAPGSYFFTLAPPTPTPTGTPNQDWSFQSAAAELDASRPLDMRLPLIRVSGRVTGPEGAPLPGVLVSAESLGWVEDSFGFAKGQAQTDEVGEYALWLFTGRASFLLTPAPGLGPTLAIAEVNGDTTLDFAVPPGVRIAGYVRGHAGEAIGGVQLRLTNETTNRDVSLATTDARGYYELQGAPGRYTMQISDFVASSPNPEAWWSVSSAPFDVTTDLSLDVPLPVARVEGRVTNARGRPVPGVQVHTTGFGTLDDGGFHFSKNEATSAADGSYTLMTFTGDVTFSFVPPADSGSATTVLPNVRVRADLGQSLILQGRAKPSARAIAD
ncbi:MAG: hypothetical protein RL033_2487, partial [Pseudomonadota bacterium]